MRWLDNLGQATALLGKSPRCVHIGDRQSDIYELFCAAHDAGTHFLVRTCVDRMAEEGVSTMDSEMQEVPVKGLHRIEVRDKKGQRSWAVLTLKCRRLRLLLPLGKADRYPPLTLTVIRVLEEATPKGRERIDWKLLTDLALGCSMRPENAGN